MAASLHVLYAEDDENDAFFMERAFVKLKRRDALHIVETGRQAIDYLAGTGVFADRTAYPLPSLLILDVKMPQMSGLEVLRWVRAHPAFARLVVVMFTSSTQDSDVRYSRAHGAHAYFVKPSNAEHLALLIGDLLDAAGRARLSPQPLPVPGNRVTS